VTFDPSRAFIDCPKCDSASHVERVKGEQWHCNCCSHSFAVSLPALEAGSPAGRVARREAHQPTAALQFITAALLVALLPALGNAQTFHVAPTGQDANPGTAALPWRTVTKAAQTLTAGQTALIHGGTYAEQDIRFAHSGAPGQPITLQAAPGETPIIDAGFTTSYPPDGIGETPVIQIDGRHHITLDGLTLMRGRTSNIFIANDQPTTDITIRNCTLRDFTTGDNAASIYVNTNAHRIVIRDNVIKGRQGDKRANVANGIILFNVGDVTIANNEIADLVQGISYKHSVDRTDAVIVENNSIHDITDYGMLWSKKDAIIRGNLFYRNGLSPGNSTILVFQEAAPCGSLVSSGNRIEHNTLVDNSAGITVTRSTACAGAINTTIRDNLVVDYSNGEYRGLAVMPYRDLANNGTRLEHNLIASSKIAGAHAFAGQGYYTLPSLPASITQVGNLTTMPVFVNAAARDYTLAAGSPGKGAASDGTDIGAIICAVGPRASCSAPPPPPPPPVPVDCAGTWGAWSRVAGSESACTATGTRTFSESRLFTVVTPASNGGAACPVSPESRTSTEACVPPVQTVTYTCWVTGTPTNYADGDVRRTVRCDTNGPVSTLPTGTTFTVTVPRP